MLKKSWFNFFITSILFVLVYFLTAKFGLNLAFRDTNATHIWIPAGIALALLLLKGNKYWPVIFVSAFIVNFYGLYIRQFNFHTTFLISFLTSFGNTAEAFIGIYVINRFSDIKNRLDTLMESFILILIGILSPAIASFNGSIVFCTFSNNWNIFWPMLTVWWLGDMLGILLFTPLIMFWKDRNFLTWKPRIYTELIFFILILLVFVFFITKTNFPIKFLFFPLLLWSAFRFGKFETFVFIVLVYIYSIYTNANRIQGEGFYLKQPLFIFQFYFSALSATFILVSAVLHNLKKASLIIEESTNLLQSVIDNSPSLLYVFDIEGKLILANKPFLKLFEASAGKIIGFNRESFLPKEIAKAHRDNDLEVIRSKKAQFFDEENIEADGIHYYQTNKFPLYDNSGNIYAVCGISTDITEKKISEQEISKAHNLITSTLENMNDGFVSLNRDWIYTYVNANAAKLLNRKVPEDLIGKHIWTEYPEGIGQPFYQNYHKVMNTGEGIIFEEHYEPWNRWFENRIIPTSEGISIFFTEITERKLAEKKLQDISYQNKILFDYAPIPIWEEDFSKVKTEFDKLNKSGIKDLGKYFDENLKELERITALVKIIAVNKKSEEFYEVDGIVQLTKRLNDWFIEDSWRFFRDELVALAEGQTKFETEIKIKTPKGIYKHLYSSLNIPPESHQSWKRVFISFVDITEQKQAQENLEKYQENLEKLIKERTEKLEEQSSELKESQTALLYLLEDVNESRDEMNKLNEQIKASNKELEAFSFSVSHDLRAPLRAIDGFTRILMEDYVDKLDDEGKRLGDIIQENAQKMGKLIDDLLAFSRLGRASMQFSSIDMKNMANAIYHEATSSSERKRIEFSVADLPDAFGDTNMLRQVWMNLISNAVKFSSKREKAVISITGIQDDDKITYTITDNGVGFNMQYVNKIFEVFQRLHGDEEYPGTGVGLSLVQRIINRHKGKIWAESEVDKGATFYFSLPNKID